MTTSDLTGTLFAGRYRLERKLGSGGMADVWLAEDQELGRRVAVKILHERYASDEQFVERFRREATHAAGLSHPNIVSIYDRGVSDGSYFIVMEYIEGRTLKELIVTRGHARAPERGTAPSDDRARLGHLARPGAGDAEVGHLDAPLAVDDHVVGLDVAVDDAVAVRVAKGGEDLARVRDRHRHGAGPARDDQLLQRPSLDVLHDDEVGPSLTPGRRSRRCSGAKPRGVGRFAPEALYELLVARIALVQDLDCDTTAELLVLGKPDVRHASRAELPLEPIAARKQ